MERSGVKEVPYRQFFLMRASQVISCFLGILCLLGGQASPVRADQFYQIVEYTCLPGMGYFHLSTVSLPDIDAEQLPPSDQMAKGPMGLLDSKGVGKASNRMSIRQQKNRGANY